MKRQRYLLQFYDRYSRIERANNSLEFQARRVKLMPERGCRKGILLVAWGSFMRRVETAPPLVPVIYVLLYIVRDDGLLLQVRNSSCSSICHLADQDIRTNAFPRTS